MRNRMATTCIAVLAIALVAGVATPASAQEGKLKINLDVGQAYVYADGKALGPMVWKGRTFKVAPGSHDISIYSYGHKPYHRTVDIEAGQKVTIDVSLEPVSGNASPPYGRLQFEGVSGNAGILLNGKTPDYHVGHVGMTNHNFIAKQELLVPPGTHLVTLVKDGQEVWSGEVTVNENERVIVRPGKDESRKSWDRGSKLGSVPRFKAGLMSVTVAVLPTEISSFSASPSSINCLDSSRLSWATTEAVDAMINGEDVATSGEQLVEPRSTTTYKLEAAGPGGRKEQSVTVNVNTEVEASLSASPAEITYKKFGERVTEHGTSTLTWSTGNANEASISPGIGDVSASGSRQVQPAPRQTDPGPVNETVAYTLTASNPCGGSGTRTASVRITGEIVPLPEIVLASVFFPTDYPDERNPNLGLLASQRTALAQLADGFKDYLRGDPDASLLLEAHADERRSVEYNRELSQRRAAIVKQFLVDAGVPSGNIETRAMGEDQPLDVDTVRSLEEQNPSEAPRRRVRSRRANWLAHNRRVDIVLRPTGDRSQRYYPHGTEDSNILWQVPKPARRTVEGAQ
jgi:hypothetical protein